MQSHTYTCLEQGLNSGGFLHSFMFSCLYEHLAIDCLVLGFFCPEKSKLVMFLGVQWRSMKSRTGAHLMSTAACLGACSVWPYRLTPQIIKVLENTSLKKIK